MTRYINWDDVANRYADAAKHTGGSESLKENYIVGAEGTVDAALASRYSVPFSPVPDLIADICIDIAYFKLTIRNRQLDKDPLKAYIDERLKGLLDGTLTLSVSGSLLGGRDRAWSSGMNYGSAFGLDCVTNWAVSSAWATDIAEGRN